MDTKRFTLGTTDSRRRGGIASYEVRRANKNDIFTRKKIHIPLQSEGLAEFLGIMIGDGGVNKYQVSIALNLKSDWEYCGYVAKLIHTLFGVTATLQIRATRNCVVLVVSSAHLVDFLVQSGLPKGHKIRNGLDMPDWIKDDPRYSTACLRGIFDTDGGIYQEVHKYRAKRYAYARMAFVSASPPLVESIFNHLNYLGLQPKVRGSQRVLVERFTDVDEYFRIVGSSNPKHIHRFTTFGGVG